MRLRNSFWAGINGSQELAAPADAVEKIRAEMLAALGLYNQVKYRSLDVQITFAADIEALWQLRPNLRDAIADRHGEDVANERVRQVTRSFAGHHPAAKSSSFFRR